MVAENNLCYLVYRYDLCVYGSSRGHKGIFIRGARDLWYDIVCLSFFSGGAAVVVFSVVAIVFRGCLEKVFAGWGGFSLAAFC